MDETVAIGFNHEAEPWVKVWKFKRRRWHLGAFLFQNLQKFQLLDPSEAHLQKFQLLDSSDRDFIVYKSGDCKCTVLSRSFKRYQIHRDYKSIYYYPKLLYIAKANNSFGMMIKEKLLNNIN